MKPEDLIEQLLLLVDELGWDIALAHSEEQEFVKGMIIGEKEYINLIASHLPKNTSKETDTELH